MIKVIKFLLSFICYIVIIPLLLGLTISLTWYLLPAFQTTQLGIMLNQFIGGEQIIAITTFVLLGLFILFFVLSRVFRVIKNSKANNFYTHIVTWLLALVLIAETIYTFFVAEALTTVSFELNLIRKIGIGAGAIAMLIYSIIGPKIRKLVDRKIQAYDTAKELNANGRSSVVWMQILKALDFCCPELLLLGVLCFAFNFDIALYFIIIIIAFIIPIIGNMICDTRVKKEAVRKQEEEREVLVNEIANAVNDLNTNP